MPTKRPIEQWTQEELLNGYRKLQQENGERRIAASRYEEIFSRFSAEMQTGLLQVLGVLADDRKAGAEMLREVAESVLGPATKEEDNVTDLPPNVGQQSATGGAPETGGDDTLTELLELVKAQGEEIKALKDERDAQAQQAVRQEYDEAVTKLNGLGYDDKTDPDKWNNMVQLLNSDLIGGDIDRAHALYDTFFPSAEGGEGGEGGQQQQDDGQQQQQQQDGDQGTGDPKFPVTAGKGTSGGPNLDSGNDEELDLSATAVSERAREYLENYAASNP